MFFLDIGLAFNLRVVQPNDAGFIVLFVVLPPPSNRCARYTSRAVFFDAA
jgi:hypothetical protein